MLEIRGHLSSVYAAVAVSSLRLIIPVPDQAGLSDRHSSYGAVTA